MFPVFSPSRKVRGMTRRDVLQAGVLAAGGLTLADLLRLRARAGEAPPASSDKSLGKSVIMIWMRGGPSHIDSFDMKPEAPLEVRGEFRPIDTNVPGIQICELMPRLAKMMDKLAIIRGIRSNDLGDHTPHYIITGSGDRGKRPAFGAVVSHLQPRDDGIPPYVSLMYDPPKLYDNEGPVYLGQSHRPFVPRAEGLDNLQRPKDVSANRLHDRRALLASFDQVNRSVEGLAAAGTIDVFTERAFEMIASAKARDAFDLSAEADKTRERYGKYSENFLAARRLVEAGIPVVTLKVGDWDTHEKNFIEMRDQLPKLDQGFEALVSDLHERGLDKDVAVVLWGEFGRAPRISRGDGRDHWPEAGAAVLAGGGFRTGQAIGETDSHGGRNKSRPYTPGNVMSNLYRHLGIDPATMLTDHNGRPVPVLEEREPVRELL